MIAPALPAPIQGGQQNLRRAASLRRPAAETRGLPGLPVPHPAWLWAAESPREPEVPTPAPTFQTRAALKDRGCPPLPAGLAVPSPGSEPNPHDHFAMRWLAPCGARAPGWCRALRGKPKPASPLFSG